MDTAVNAQAQPVAGPGSVRHAAEQGRYSSCLMYRLQQQQGVRGRVMATLQEHSNTEWAGISPEAAAGPKKPSIISELAVG